MRSRNAALNVTGFPVVSSETRVVLAVTSFVPVSALTIR